MNWIGSCGVNDTWATGFDRAAQKLVIGKCAIVVGKQTVKGGFQATTLRGR
jgi:hypothetical protein